MKWLKKWGYLILFIVVGLFYFSYVDQWKVYRDVLEQSVVLAGDLGVSDLPDWLENWTADEGPAQDDDGPEKDGQGEAEEEAESDAAGDREEAEGADEAGENIGQAGSENNTEVSGDTDKDESSDNQVESTAPETDSGSGSHIPIGGPNTGGEVDFGDNTEEEPDFRSVKDLYFADAVFIGDSRTVGLFEYGGLENVTTFYASQGLSVYDIFDKKIVTVEGQKKKITVEEALQHNSFSKIYLMLGLNEMGTGTTETFLVKYGEVLGRLQELQPDAIIYVQAIMKITTERSGKGDQFHNEGIEARNQGLSEFADNEKIFFLDVNPLICDETGGMIEDYTYDGIHLKAKYIEIWKDYLKEHAIVP